MESLRGLRGLRGYRSEAYRSKAYRSQRRIVTQCIVIKVRIIFFCSVVYFYYLRRKKISCRWQYEYRYKKLTVIFFLWTLILIIAVHNKCLSGSMALTSFAVLQ